MTPLRIPFTSVAPRDDALAVRAAIDRVIANERFILGPEVEAFEEEFAAASGAAHAVGVGTGTDALALIFRALGVGEGDEVITTPLSAAFTALAIMMAGARPVFADIDADRLTIDPAAVAAAVTARTRAILPVHLYGQPAAMEPLERIAAHHGLAIVEDCCQAHLATAHGRPVGTIGAAGAFSFYPTKNLGAFGDGGAVITNDASLAARIRRLRNGGQSTTYAHDEPGVNSRLDELQAAILRARLPLLASRTAKRRALASAYRQELDASPVVPVPQFDPGHVYHLFVVRSPRHAELQQHLRARGIDTLVHYPVPIPKQPALAAARSSFSQCPHADCACHEVLSLPFHPALADRSLQEVAAAIRDFPEVV